SRSYLSHGRLSCVLRRRRAIHSMPLPCTFARPLRKATLLCCSCWRGQLRRVCRRGKVYQGRCASNRPLNYFAGVNAFEDLTLTALQRHAAELTLTPSAWMPWNYRETL